MLSNRPIPRRRRWSCSRGRPRRSSRPGPWLWRRSRRRRRSRCRGAWRAAGRTRGRWASPRARARCSQSERACTAYTGSLAQAWGARGHSDWKGSKTWAHTYPEHDHDRDHVDGRVAQVPVGHIAQRDPVARLLGPGGRLQSGTVCAHVTGHHEGVLRVCARGHCRSC